MSQFIASPSCGALQTYICQTDPRYQIRSEWVVCRDGVRRARYRAYFCGCTIGEIAPGFRRETVLDDLRELIAAGGIGAMQAIPTAGGDAE
ncbi:MAG: hypothetical protein VB104_04180 [Candidatus Limiplasma sp.]|nr:hypothetical protein [Candidatus Limiplasma sp.]